MYTGKRSPIEDDYDIDHKITEIIELTRTFITELIKEVGEEDYKKIAKSIISEHLDIL